MLVHCIVQEIVAIRFTFKGCKSFTWATTCWGTFSGGNLIKSALNLGIDARPVEDCKLVMYWSLLDIFLFTSIAYKTSGAPPPSNSFPSPPICFSDCWPLERSLWSCWLFLSVSLYIFSGQQTLYSFDWDRRSEITAISLFIHSFIYLFIYLFIYSFIFWMRRFFYNNVKSWKF